MAYINSRAKAKGHHLGGGGGMLRLKPYSENLLVTRHLIKHCVSNHVCPLTNQRVRPLGKSA